MSKLEKLKAKTKNNPASVRYAELEKLILELGFTLVNVRGSHHVYKKENRILTLVKPHGRKKFCAIVDVKKVLEFLEKDETK